MKLWEKGYEPDKIIERFTVGKDPVLDLLLLPYDIQGSVAHAAVLYEAGFLNQTEKKLLVSELNEILKLSSKGRFHIRMEDEDGHTAIENYLTRKLGATGKKIHTGRSRNDQVLTALRLFEKDKLGELRRLALGFQKKLVDFSEMHQNVPMPGYTHTRKAMPYTVGKWAGSFTESLSDDLILLDSALALVDKNPLGTGAGFGINFPLNREASAGLLGFNGLIENSLYAQNSRGKTETAVLFGCVSVLSTLNRWASDLILFTAPEFGFFSLENQMTTGSSIMPHKKNPDVLELIRATVHEVTAHMFQVQNTVFNLMSGYHRDLQLTKEPLINGLMSTLTALQAASTVVDGIAVERKNLERAMVPELYSVDKVYALVQKGMPFREAYQLIAAELFEKDAER